jgi:lysozyme family protein
MRENFEQSLKWVLQDEGGNNDDPRDRGGRTSRGITQREYDAWCHLNGRPFSDVWVATDEDIKTIYKDQYWNPYCDFMPSGVDYVFFDISVNSGRTRAVQQFQKALEINVDGMMGQITRQSILTVDPSELINRVSDINRNYYKHLEQFPIYGKGWLHRADHRQQGALSLVHSLDYDKPVNDDPTGGQDDQDPAKPKIKPEVASTAAAGSGGLAGMLDQFKETLEPYQHALSYVKYALLAIAVVGIGFAVYGFYKRSKVQAAV